MILYPDLYFKDVTQITIEILNQNNIKGLILDVDNTLIDFDKNINNQTKQWIETLKKANIKLYIVSNTNKIEKVKAVSTALDIPYIYFAKKPSKKGFLKAKEKMNLDEKNIAAVGDQIMTDVIGANRCNMLSILVKPIDKRDIFMTKIKRPLEQCIINSYLKKMKKEKE